MAHARTKAGVRPQAPKPDHPRQVMLKVHTTNGVTNSLVFTLHKGDYSFVDKIEIDGIEVGYLDMSYDEILRARTCVTQESGHKVPASSIRKVDGRIIGACEKCYARVNIARFPGTEDCAEAAGLLQAVLFSDINDGMLEGVNLVQKRLLQDQQAIAKALDDMRRARAIIINRQLRKDDSDQT